MLATLFLALVSTASHHMALAKTQDTFAGVPAERYSEKIVRTEDGVDQKLIVLDNPGKPIILMEPGLGAQGTSHEQPAAYFYKLGYSVVIGNWRGSVKLPKPYRMLGQHNRLEEVLRKDFPAHLRFIIREFATPDQLKYGITLLGHSMGGMMIMGALSDPKLYEEFLPHLRAIVLFQSPHHVKYVQPHMKVLARIAVPLLETLKKMGIEAIDMHSKLMLLSQEAKAQGGVKGYVLMPAIENLAISLTRTAFDPKHTGREAYRRAFFKMPSYSIPVDLLLSFARAVANGGTFATEAGESLINPERIRGVPTLVALSTRDTLAPNKEQHEYKQKLGTPHKQLIVLEDFNHIESVLIHRKGTDFYPLIKSFIDEPYWASLENEFVEFKPNCETWLTALSNKIKKKLRP